MLLETVGGGDFVVKKRGSVDLSSKGVVDTFWSQSYQKLFSFVTDDEVQ
jgi:hypothetical protein